MATKKWHCEICKMFGTNGITISWHSLDNETKTFLKAEGWSEKSYDTVMNFLDHSPDFYRYAKRIVKKLNK